MTLICSILLALMIMNPDDDECIHVSTVLFRVSRGDPNYLGWGTPMSVKA